jgi:hypothetical protein
MQVNLIFRDRSLKGLNWRQICSQVNFEVWIMVPRSREFLLNHFSGYNLRVLNTFHDCRPILKLCLVMWSKPTSSEWSNRVLTAHFQVIYILPLFSNCCCQLVQIDKKKERREYTSNSYFNKAHACKYTIKGRIILWGVVLRSNLFGNLCRSRIVHGWRDLDQNMEPVETTLNRRLRAGATEYGTTSVRDISLQ